MAASDYQANSDARLRPRSGTMVVGASEYRSAATVRGLSATTAVSSAWAGSSSRFIVITVGNHIGAPGRVRGALAPAAGCALWYLLTEPVAGHHCAPSGQRALLLGCQRAWAGARHIRGPADRPRGRVGLRYPSRPAESGGNSQTQCGERQTQVPHHGVPFSSRWRRTLHQPGDNSAGLLRQHFTCRRRVCGVGRLPTSRPGRCRGFGFSGQLAASHVQSR